MPSASSRRATVDLPEPAGPHMRTTRGTGANLPAPWADARRAPPDRGPGAPEECEPR